MEQNPDVVDSYFGLLSRVRKVISGGAYRVIIYARIRLLEDVH